MRKTKVAALMPLALGLLMMMSGIAHAAVSVTVTSPKEGAKIDKSMHPNTIVKGTVHFDPPPPSQTTFYYRRDACGGADNPHLSVVSGVDAGDGCGFVVVTASANDVTQVKEEYPAQDGVPFTLDTTGGKTIDGHYFVECFLSPTACSIGQVTVDFTLTGTTATGSVTIGTASQTQTYLPTDADHDFTFSMTPDASLNGKQITSLNMETYIHGVSPLIGFVEYSGKSYFTVPTPSTNVRRVQISVDNANFTKPIVATLNKTFTAWSKKIKTPAVGAHTIYVRAIQNATVSPVAVRHITVVA